MLNSIVGLFFCIPIYLVLLLWGIKNKYSFGKHIVIFMFSLYIGFVISLTIFPLPFQKEVIEMNQQAKYMHNNFIPFKSICQLIKTGNMYIIIRNILGNIALFMPLGFILPLISKRKLTIKSISIIGLMSSIGVEFIQYCISLILGYTYKITDVDDIILNFIGAILGFIALKLICIIKE